MCWRVLSATLQASKYILFTIMHTTSVDYKTSGRELSEIVPCWCACLYYGLQSQSPTDPHVYACVGMDCNPRVQLLHICMLV